MKMGILVPETMLEATDSDLRLQLGCHYPLTWMALGPHYPLDTLSPKISRTVNESRPSPSAPLSCYL
jgi:hypothetical protein